MAVEASGANASKAPAPDTIALSLLWNEMPKLNARSLGSDAPPFGSPAWFANEDAPRGGGVAAWNGESPPDPERTQTAPTEAALLRETVSRQYSETKSTGELVIKDQTGRAKVTKPMKGVRVEPSGGV